MELTAPTLEAERADRLDIIDRIDIILDSCLIFKRTAEGKAIANLLSHLRHSIRRRAAPVAEGVELPKPTCLLPGVYAYTANQVRQAQRDALVASNRDIGLLKIVCDQLKARIAAADARIEELERMPPKQSIDTPSSPTSTVAPLEQRPMAQAVDVARDA